MSDFNDLKSAIDKVIKGTETVQHLKNLLNDEELNVNDIGSVESEQEGVTASMQGPILHQAMLAADYHANEDYERAREVVKTLLDDDRLDLNLPSVIKGPEGQEGSLNTLMCATQANDFDIFEKCFNHATMDAKAQLSAKLPEPPNLGEGVIVDQPLNFLFMLSFKEHMASASHKGEHDPTWTLISNSDAYKEIVEEYREELEATATRSGAPGLGSSSDSE